MQATGAGLVEGHCQACSRNRAVAMPDSCTMSVAFLPEGPGSGRAGLNHLVPRVCIFFAHRCRGTSQSGLCPDGTPARGHVTPTLECFQPVDGNRYQVSWCRQVVYQDPAGSCSQGGIFFLMLPMPVGEPPPDGLLFDDSKMPDVASDVVDEDCGHFSLFCTLIVLLIWGWVRAM